MSLVLVTEAGVSGVWPVAHCAPGQGSHSCQRRSGGDTQWQHPCTLPLCMVTPSNHISLGAVSIDQTPSRSRTFNGLPPHHCCLVIHCYILLSGLYCHCARVLIMAWQWQQCSPPLLPLLSLIIHHSHHWHQLSVSDEVIIIRDNPLHHHDDDSEAGDAGHHGQLLPVSPGARPDPVLHWGPRPWTGGGRGPSGQGGQLDLGEDEQLWQVPGVRYHHWLLLTLWQNILFPNEY